MKNLIIHPSDPTTDFLKPIYSNINDAIIVNGGVSKDQLTQLIKEHDRIIMMGHGSPSGLFAVGVFSDAKSSIYPQRFNYAYAIDSSTVSLLKDKECIAIWCNADQFMNEHQLNGFYSGMFISEVSEAAYCGLPGTLQETVNLSNNYFSQLVGEVINEPLSAIYEHVMDNYELIVDENPVALYNYNRLYLAE
jgi:hypothetical protein